MGPAFNFRALVRFSSFFPGALPSQLEIEGPIVKQKPDLTLEDARLQHKGMTPFADALDPFIGTRPKKFFRAVNELADQANAAVRTGA
jgi:hypothetical protein